MVYRPSESSGRRNGVEESSLAACLEPVILFDLSATLAMLSGFDLLQPFDFRKRRADFRSRTQDIDQVRLGCDSDARSATNVVATGIRRCTQVQLYSLSNIAGIVIRNYRPRRWIRFRACFLSHTLPSSSRRRRWQVATRDCRNTQALRSNQQLEILDSSFR
jgi:hypothetical protein